MPKIALQIFTPKPILHTFSIKFLSPIQSKFSCPTNYSILHLLGKKTQILPPFCNNKKFKNKKTKKFINFSKKIFQKFFRVLGGNFHKNFYSFSTLATNTFSPFTLPTTKVAFSFFVIITSTFSFKNTSFKKWTSKLFTLPSAK